MISAQNFSPRALAVRKGDVAMKAALVGKIR
jgi:hypothetical protein